MPNSNNFIEIDSNLAEGMESFLIEAVRQHPIIYSKDDKYRSHILFNEKLASAWNQISDELNVEVESCKTLWSCIKQKFIKYRKRKEYGHSMVKEWPAYQGLLEWLDEHVKKRRTRNELIKRLNATRSETNETQVTTDVGFEEESENGDTTEWKFSLVNIDNGGGSSTDEVNSSSKKRPIGSTITYSGKRTRSFKTESSISPPNKMKLKQERYNTDANTIEFEHETEQGENDGEIITELELTPDDIAAVNSMAVKSIDMDKSINDNGGGGGGNGNANTSSSQIVLNDKSAVCRDVVLEANFDKLEQVIGKCVSLAEKCIANYASQDSNEIFGKFIGSMLLELPADQRMKARFEIIQFTGDLIAKSKQ